MDPSVIVELLEKFWPRNKAKGLLAQTVFTQETNNGVFGRDGNEKSIQGCWLLAPKEADFYKFRYAFFVHPGIMRSDATVYEPKAVFGPQYRPFHAIAEFMNGAGVGVMYVIPVTASGNLPADELKAGNFGSVSWKFFSFQNGEFISKDPNEFFSLWSGNRGHAGRVTEWDPVVKNKIKVLRPDILMELLLNELFYVGFLKGILKKPTNDPYDVDSFLISLSQKHIFPMEIKEKFPGQSGADKFFGIDAGRIMMLLRLCLPNDANSVYLIRELDESGRFIGWKYTTLSDIIMTASWNLQAGGPGMGGQSTQTVKLPYSYFRNFEAGTLSEENLQKIGNLPKDIKALAKQFGTELSARFHR